MKSADSSRTRINISCLLVCCAAFATSVYAVNPVMQDHGVGAKALSMGNSFVAVADDFSAVYWNPAGLAFMPVRELQFSLDAMQDGITTDLNGTATEARQQRLRFGHFGLVRSIPTHRGGFTFALGLIRPTILDNVFSIRGIDTYHGLIPRYSFGPYEDTIIISAGDQAIYDKYEDHVNGQLNMITISAGWQVAPAIGIGFSVSPMFGTENRSGKYYTFKAGPTLDTLFEHSTEKNKRYLYGVDLRGGLLYAPGERLRLGLRLQIPQYLSIIQNYSRRDADYTYFVEEYNGDHAFLATSLSGALGASYRFPFMVLSCEASGRAPFPDAEQDTPSSQWRGGASFGMEAPIPKLSSVLRAGYAWKQLDMYHYSLEWKADGQSMKPNFRTDDDLQMLTAGFAVLLKDFAVIEAAYAYSMWQYASLDDVGWSPVTEDHSRHRVQLSFSLRY